MSTIRIAQYFSLIAFDSDATAYDIALNPSKLEAQQRAGKVFRHYYQNYFINEKKQWPASTGPSYDFLPFRAEGAIASLNGDNVLLQVLIPHVEVALRLVEQGNGNRLSRLSLTTVWLNANEAPAKSYEEKYVGIGASYSDSTIELRFRGAMDSVGANFPARTLSRSLVGILPLSADLFLQ